jgi:hypothetical protein
MMEQQQQQQQEKTAAIEKTSRIEARWPASNPMQARAKQVRVGAEEAKIRNQKKPLDLLGATPTDFLTAQSLAPNNLLRNGEKLSRSCSTTDAIRGKTYGEPKFIENKRVFHSGLNWVCCAGYEISYN